MPMITTEKAGPSQLANAPRTATEAPQKAAIRDKGFDAQTAALKPDGVQDLDARRQARETRVMQVDEAEKAPDGSSKWAEAALRYFARWDIKKDGKLTAGEIARTLKQGVVTAPGQPAERVGGEELMGLATAQRALGLIGPSITPAAIQAYATDFKDGFASRPEIDRSALMGLEAAFINGKANVDAAAALEAELAGGSGGTTTAADAAMEPLKQGGHVSCSLLATALGMMNRDPAAISQMVKFLGVTVEPSKGKKLGEKIYRFEVNFFQNGKPARCEVKLYEWDMLMAARGGGLAYAAIEALFVLGQGDIRSLTADNGVGTTGTKAIEAMSGAKAKYMEVKKTPVADLSTAIIAACNDKRVVVAGTKERPPKGLSPSHAYTVLACDGSTLSLFDPHAKDPEGADGVSADSANDGYFTIKLEAFLEAFHHVDIEQPKATQ